MSVVPPASISVIEGSTSAKEAATVTTVELATPPSAEDDVLQTEEELKALTGDGKATLEFILSFWDAVTHCVEPEHHHQVTEKLQEALEYETIKLNPPESETAPAADEPAPQPEETPEETPEQKTRREKEYEWDCYGAYRIFAWNDDGTPQPDADWPADYSLVVTRPTDGKDAYFQVFQNAVDAATIVTTNEELMELSTPELNDEGVIFYRFRHKYRFGNAAYDADGTYTTIPFLQKLYYDYAEHCLLGNKVYLRFSDDENIIAEERKLRQPNGNQLTYGEINALGGDFFATSRPISTGGNFDEQCSLFKAAYATLAQSDRGAHETHEIQVIMEKEMDAVKEATDNGTKEAATRELYKEINKTDRFLSEEDTKLNDVTRRPDGPSYIEMAQLNLDHFGNDGRIAYIAGHFCALQAAAAGDLEAGYSLNAFADHFLGDAFAAGHFRTPRRALHGSGVNLREAVDMIVKIAGTSSRVELAANLLKAILNPFNSVIKTFNAMAPDLCSKYMHEEDNVLGLMLKNPRGDQWKAFGDSKLFEPVNKQNRLFMSEALQASADDVYAAYKSKVAERDPSKYAALRIAPSGELPGHNHNALFDARGWYRTPWEDRGSSSYTDPTRWNVIKGYKLLAIDFIKSDYFKNLK
jgi:hypothetical protein